MDRNQCVPGIFGESQFAGAELGDRRRTKRLIRLGDQILSHPEGTLPDKIPNPHQLDAAYRLFGEREVTHDAILAPHGQQVRQAMTAQPGIVLVPHDGTEFNFSGLDIPDLGKLAGPKSRGILCHNSLAMTASGQVLGLAHQTLFLPQPKPAKDTKSEAAENPDKISTRWRNAMEAIGPTPPGGRWIHLADRGADITEFLDYADEHRREYVVRASHNRNLEDREEGTVQRGHRFDHLRAMPPVSRRRQAISHQRKRAARTATLSITFTGLTILPPPQARGRERGIALPVTAIRVWEPNPPTGGEALEWFLLTNVPCANAADAWERSDWYSHRWGIEEFHKAQKTGLRSEDLQLTSVHRLSNALAVFSVVAVAMLILRDGARQPDRAELPARQVLPWSWVELLSRWRYGEVRELTMREWVMALGRLGGHQNRPSDGLPGWQTLWRGWGKLATMMEGYRIWSNVDK